MSTLRKACRGCTKAKRKCIVQRPKCARCAQKDLDCIYDLEHLNAPRDEPEILVKLHSSLSYSSLAGHCIIKTLKSRNPGIDPALSMPGDKNGLELIRLGYQSIPDFIREGNPALFFHPELQLRGDWHNHLEVFKNLVEDSVAYEEFRHLIQIDIRTLHFQEALTALQALLVYLGTFLFSDYDLRRGAEGAMGILSEWTRILLESAKYRIPRNVSPWQEWLLGESVRRTIMMSHALIMAQSSYRYGYCLDWLFLESLPFDGRSGLWMARSPQAWIAVAGAKTGAEVGERLQSLHEFAESHERSGRNLCGDLFLFLITVFHNGHKIS